MITVLLVSAAAVALIYVVVMATLTQNVRKATQQDEQRYQAFLVAMDDLLRKNPRS